MDTLDETLANKFAANKTLNPFLSKSISVSSKKLGSPSPSPTKIFAQKSASPVLKTSTTDTKKFQNSNPQTLTKNTSFGVLKEDTKDLNDSDIFERDESNLNDSEHNNHGLQSKVKA